MSAMVIYESMFGNTKRVADAVAEGLARHLPVKTVEVSEAPTEVPVDVELLVVGGPTHDYGMSTKTTRIEAATERPEALVSKGIGLREWLATARAVRGGVPATAFDTRINIAAILSGSAAQEYAALLGAAGFELIVPATSYRLTVSEAAEGNALIEGELDKAREWGAAIGAELGARRR